MTFVNFQNLNHVLKEPNDNVLVKLTLQTEIGKMAHSQTLSLTFIKDREMHAKKNNLKLRKLDKRMQEFPRVQRMSSGHKNTCSLILIRLQTLRWRLHHQSTPKTKHYSLHTSGMLRGSGLPPSIRQKAKASAAYGQP